MCGVTSRRGAEKLIDEGKVSLNGHKIDIPGQMIDPENDMIKVDGVVVTPADEKVYILLNKPAQVMTTLHDPFKRRTIADLLTRLKLRVYPVGRLDYDTTGVLLLTNDGELAYRLTHPKYQVPRLYEARVSGKFGREAAVRIADGISLEDGAIGKAQVVKIEVGKKSSKVRLLLTEGRKREVKQLCKAVGYPVLELKRLEFAGFTIGALKPGKWRRLKQDEVVYLKKLVGITV